jgi:hypothetical protein
MRSTSDKMNLMKYFSGLDRFHSMEYVPAQ